MRRQAFWAAVLFLSTQARAAPPAPAAEPQPEPLQVQVARELLAIPEDKLDIGRAALMLSTAIDPRTDVPRGLVMLDELAARVRVLLAGRTDPELRIRAINTVIYGEQKFQYDTTDLMGKNLNNQYFWGLLTRKKGNCVTLPTLWYAVAERLGFPVKAVSAPQHTFLRYEEGDFRSNIETTSGGGTITDERVIRDLAIPRQAIATGNMMRSLSKREFLLELILVLATQFHRFDDFGIARALNELVMLTNKGSMVAHYNLAVIWSELAATTTAIKGTSPKRAAALAAEAQWRAKVAVSHAREATALGAVPPLEDEYWKKVSSLAGPEKGVATTSPPPFELETYLQPGGSPILIQDRRGMLPTWADAMYQGFETPGALVLECAKMCGPAPGNQCIEVARVFR